MNTKIHLKDLHSVFEELKAKHENGTCLQQWILEDYSVKSILRISWCKKIEILTPSVYTNTLSSVYDNQ